MMRFRIYTSLFLLHLVGEGDAFNVILPNIRGVSRECLQSEILTDQRQRNLQHGSQPSRRESIPPLSALKKKSKQNQAAGTLATLTPSEKIQEMASFLAIQLLEVAMKEVAKGEGESKMTLEDVEKLAEALQGQMVETKQAQDKLETTWDAAGDAIEELLADEGMTKLEPPSSLKNTVGADRTVLDDKKARNDDEADAEVKAPELAQLKDDQSSDDMTAVPPPPMKKPEDIKPVATQDTVKGTNVTITPKETMLPLESPAGIRIPNVISAEFGRPLEVVASNVNPLREMPKRNPKVEGQTHATLSLEKIETPKSVTTVVTSELESSKRIVPQTTRNESSRNDLKSRQAQEHFQRKLLEARYQMESKNKTTSIHASSTAEATSSTETEPSPDTPTSQSQSDTVLHSSEPLTNEEQPHLVDQASSGDTEIPTAESKGESVDSIRKFLSQPPTKPSQLSISKISESRLKSIIDARRQPKGADEEAVMAEKYAKMSVEDRAFAILFDLGMIDQNKDPSDPSYDHSDDDEICEQLHFPS
ncbi:hypothetical protein IV203_029788 [Nitzschia inconspicua]|uniref:Uncharacterized protein n=1 Tax=Nitzschia inconspicua TaxID=303405 RepID=A0A9K3K7M6_9STRA|nr:hypothetical protein IV203_004869 [Nitzschia inconspicua]KAG7367118.1 hypothetical protein IV203_029788 [Nitzschia inconspicua]